MVIQIDPRCTLVDITDILPMNIRNVAIVTLGVFHDEILVLITIKLFLLTFCSM